MLTDAVVRNTKPSAKSQRLFDERGLYLEVAPTGGKWWRFKYRFGGKEKRLSLGTYPDVSLKDARERREAARKQLANGVDPGVIRKAERAASGIPEEGETLERVAREWHKKFLGDASQVHSDEVLHRLERDVFPWVGARPMKSVTAPELLAVVQRIESRGAPETARRVLQYLSRIGRYAVATARAERDSAADLRGALPPANKSHLASLTEPKAVAGLLRAIDGYAGAIIVRCALRLAPLVFVRPGELRKAEWAEVNLDEAEWRIPAERMKMRELHIVPLARQALEVLGDLHPLTGRGKYLFPSVRSPGRPISENTLNAALRRMGFTKEEMCAHGFRSLASTMLNELGWNRDWIERQLAHGERDAVRASYNFAQYLPDRKRMMAAWADHLEGLKEGAKIIPMVCNG